MVTRLLLDTSVLISWFQRLGEGEDDDERLLAGARAIRAAHLAGQVHVRVLDLGLYEVGNLLIEALEWAPQDVADQLDDLLAICGPPLQMDRDWLRDAAAIAGQYDLSFYDSAWAAAALRQQATLVSANRGLLAAGLAESPVEVVRRLGLTSS